MSMYFGELALSEMNFGVRSATQPSPRVRIAFNSDDPVTQSLRAGCGG